MAAAEQTLGELLDALAERSPAPGGGAAAAWAAAVGAALLEMAAAFASQGEVATRARALRARALEAGEADLHAYGEVLEATRLPRGDPARRMQLEEALSRASEPPLAIARGALEVAELASEVAAAGRPALRGDAVTAALLAEAATRAGALLVEINLESLDGDPRVTEVARLRERAATARAAALRPLSG